jgi:NAD(P)-dependent dehydrogenase (short-subunit alcohol dehydrogenase family)
MTFTDEFRQKNLPLHVLVNNAGIMMVPFELSKDGIELQLATNHVGHFLLTRRLLDILVKSKPSRVVNVSSRAHERPYSDGISFDRINDPKHYSKMGAYGQSKLANILFSRELTRRLNDDQVYVNSLHPGVVATELSRYNTLLKPFFAMALSPANGALTSLYCATSPEIETNKYHGEYFVKDD